MKRSITSDKEYKDHSCERWGNTFRIPKPDIDSSITLDKEGRSRSFTTAPLLLIHIIVQYLVTRRHTKHSAKWLARLLPDQLIPSLSPPQSRKLDNTYGGGGGQQLYNTWTDPMRPHITQICVLYVIYV